MKNLSKRETAKAAYLLANYLLTVYQDKQVPVMIDEFSRAGFTKDKLQRDRDALFRMIAIAAYDRTPYTRGSGGYENIWEIFQKGRGVPTLLSSIGLWSIDEVINTPATEIDTRLSEVKLGGVTMDFDGVFTRFNMALLDTAHLVTDVFHNELSEANTPNVIDDIFLKLTGINGIAETISAKLVKYLLREIAIGKALPEHFPLTVTWPLIQEYHASGAVAKLHLLNQNLVPLTAGILLQKDDAFAIDALFFLQRKQQHDLDVFIKKLQGIASIREPQHDK